MVDFAQYRTERRVLTFILGLTLIRVVWHLLEPIGMLGDESYYWLWGQHWDFGYYSKPPLIGWLYGLLDVVPLPKVWFFKSFGALLTAGSLYYFYRTLLVSTRNYELSWWGVVGMALSPANLMFASTLTIDAPLMFFWAGGMYFTAKLIFSENSSISRADLFALGLMLGLGHLTKQMMMLQVVVIILCVIFLKRSLLKSVAFWMTLILSFVSLAPPVFWNAQNEWITFQHTGHHFEKASPTLMKSLSRFGELWGALFGLVSPVFFLLLFPAIGSAMRNPQNRVKSFFFLFGGIGLIVMTAMVFRQRVNPNWPAVYLIGGFGLVMVWVYEKASRQGWYKLGVKVAAVMSLLMMVLLPLLDPLAKPLAEIGLKPQRRGWQGYPTLVEQTAKLATQNEVDQIVFVGHRFAASQFAFHGPFAKRVHLWNGKDYIANQFDFFPSPELAKPILIVVEQKKKGSRSEIPSALSSDVSHIQLLAEYPIHFAREYPRYKIYLANEVIRWRKSPAKKSPEDE